MELATSAWATPSNPPALDRSPPSLESPAPPGPEAAGAPWSSDLTAPRWPIQLWSCRPPVWPSVAEDGPSGAARLGLASVWRSDAAWRIQLRRLAGACLDLNPQGRGESAVATCLGSSNDRGALARE